jgi:hypothetical protein
MTKQIVRKTLKAWRTLSLRQMQFVLPDHTLDELNHDKMRVTPQAGMAIHMLGRIDCDLNEKVRLVRLTPKQLGVKNEEFYGFSRVRELSKKLGLRLCRPWIAPVLRHAWRNQLSTEFVHIAHEPIPMPLAVNGRKTFSTEMGIFSLYKEHDLGGEKYGQLCLIMKGPGSSEYLGSADALDHWVFELPN